MSTQSDPTTGRTFEGSPLVVTHPGKAHADEALACHILDRVFKGVRIARSDDRVYHERADFLVDVGRLYDPLTGRFDHHHPTRGIPRPPEGRRSDYASAGLVWAQYSLAYLKILLTADRASWKEAVDDLTAEEEGTILRGVALKADQEMVCPIDRWDNGLHSRDKSVLPMQWLIPHLEFDTLVAAIGGCFENRCRALLSQYLEERMMLLDPQRNKYWLFGKHLVVLLDERMEYVAVKRFADRFDHPVELLAYISPTSRGQWVCFLNCRPPENLEFEGVSRNRRSSALFSREPDKLVDALKVVAERLDAEEENAYESTHAEDG